MMTEKSTKLSTLKKNDAEINVVPLDKLKLNPDNPRFIRDEKYKKLLQSLKEFPEMTSVRELVVNKDFVVLGGNMRLRAMREAGWTEARVKIVDWGEEKQREFAIKDNLSYGDWDWDILINEWNEVELTEWGLDLVEFTNGGGDTGLDNNCDMPLGERTFECPQCGHKWQEN